jgi:hypothetical protein
MNSEKEPVEDDSLGVNQIQHPIEYSPTRSSLNLLPCTPRRANHGNFMVFQTSPAESPQLAPILKLPFPTLIGREHKPGTYLTISSAILTANFPTLVPPNFCTTHPASESFFHRDRGPSLLPSTVAFPALPVPLGNPASLLMIQRTPSQLGQLYPNSI